MSTPASTSCVLTTRTLSPPASFALMAAIVRERCSPHIDAERWTVPSGMKPYRSRQSLRVLTTHSTCGKVRSASATSAQVIRAAPSAGSSISVRLSRAARSSDGGMISRTPSSPGRFGWVAVERTHVVP